MSRPDTEVAPSDGRTGRLAQFRPLVFPALTAIFVILFAYCLLSLSQDRHPMSVVDEHIHFDTAARATHGEIPWRGALLSQDLIDEWACGVGHEAGALAYPCGDDRLTPQSIPSGEYTTGYIHYPTYFFAAAAFQKAWAWGTGNADLIDGYRAFSAATLIAGVIASAVMAWLLRMRGAALLAVTAMPVAASLLVFSGTIVNPASISILTGALIAGTGLLWVRRNRGFVWFALAVAFGSAIAVTASLPAGGFLIAMLVVMTAERMRRPFGGSWRPRWWHFAITAAIVLIPVVVWGRVISATATITNAELYGFAQTAGRVDIVVAAIRELAALHSPWVETGGIRHWPEGLLPRALHAFSQGIPIWLTVIVFGAIVLAAAVALRPARAPHEDFAATPRPARFTPTELIAIATVATIVLYPPALRVSNWFNFGFDFPIVDRYSIAFAPLLVMALLLTTRVRGLTTSLAVVAAISGLGVVAAGWS